MPMAPTAVALVLALPFPSACPKSWILTVYNNSGEDLVLELGTGSVARKAGAQVEVIGRSATAASGLYWESIAGEAEVPTLRVAKAGTLLVYRGISYAGSSGDYADFSGPVIRQYLQLERDGLLYLLDPRAALLSSRPGAQPSGFPLHASIQAR